MERIIHKNSLILIILLTMIASTIFYLNTMKANYTVEESEEQFIKEFNPDYIPDEKIISQKTNIYPKTPELKGIAGYINTNETLRISNLKGKVVLVDFWTYTCINCIRTLPYIKNWHEKYEDEGLVIIGVHTPEFEFEKKLQNVKDAINKHELKYPIVQDNNYATWRAFNNMYWPHKFLIDIDGFIRYDHIGEGQYDTTELVIQELLNEKKQREGNQKFISKDISEPVETIEIDLGKVKTPEIYFGYQFARGNFGNERGLKRNTIIEYNIPETINFNNAYLEGSWETNKDGSKLLSEKGKIILQYNAKFLNIVASSEEEIELEILVDGRPLNNNNKGSDVEITDKKSIAKIQKSKLYNLINFDYNIHTIEIDINGKGFEIFTFTFG